MDESIIWMLFVGWVLFTLFLAWLVGFTELSYFGNKGLKFLYNFCAPAYNIKWVNPKYSSKQLIQELFLEPLKRSLAENSSVRLLDLACGTGRMSLMVLSQDWFEGEIDSIDFSEGMLSKFRKELDLLDEKQRLRCNIHQLNLLDWKADTNEKYNVVTLMEVGEFLPNFVELIPEITKSIKANGFLLLTKPPDWMASFYPGRKQTERQLKQLLKDNGFRKITIKPWTNRYEVVWAQK